jgi:hypothetical protein
MNVRELRRGGVVLVALVIGMLAAAASGASAAGWLAPVPVPLSVSDLGFDEDGNAIAVGIGAGSGGDSVVQAISRPPGGQWSAPVPVSGSGDSDAGPPQVATNARGDAVAIWSADAASVRVVRVASRPAGGAWSNPIAISEGVAASGPYSHDYDVAIDAQGNATAIWAEFSSTSSTFVVRAASRAHGADWDEPVDFSDSALNSRPRLAVDPQGTVTAVWLGDVSVVRSKSRPVGGPWSSEAALSSEDSNVIAQDPQVAVDAQGNATAVWALHHFGGEDVVQTARRAAGGAWDSAVDLGDGSSNALPQVAVDPQGNATAIWGQSSSTSSVVLSSGRTGPTGLWSNPAPMASGDDVHDVGYPWVAADPQGNVTAIWARYNSTDVIAQATRHVAGSTSWSPSVDLTVGRPITAIPAAGIDPQGHVSMVWSSTVDPWAGSSSVFDPIAPSLRSLVAPATAVVGQQLAMSVNPFDAWSAVTTSWDFGDGQSATGAAVNHTYNSPGERTVTITGVDAEGNATQTSRTITVVPVPVPEQPGPGPGPGPSPGPNPNPSPSPAPAPKAPVLSGLQQSNARWRTRSVKRGPKLPVGTTFRFTLDRAAQVRFAFSQTVSGRRVDGRCVKTTKKNRGNAGCDRSQAAGTLNVAGKAGANTVAFRGTLRGRALPLGRYSVVVTALADDKRSAAKSVRFTIVR